MIGNSRHPRTLGSPVVALAIPFCAIADLPPGPFAAKPVLDANNYYPHRDGAVAGLEAGPLAEGWRFERAMPAYCIPLDAAGLMAALDAAQRGVELPHGCWRG